jgi:hypothetical protein
MTVPGAHAIRLACIAILMFLTLPIVSLAQQGQPIEVHRRFKLITTDSAGKHIIHEVPDTSTASPRLSFDTVKVRQNWTKLQKGYSQDDVEKLLGVPAKVQYDEACEYWWYGGSAVLFNVVTHKVTGWDK